MPRNSSGTYTLPVAAFTPGQLIASANENSNYSDIATALTQSLATTGVSTMTGPIKAASGTASAPSITFGSDSTTGILLSGTHQMGLTFGGTQQATLNSDGSSTWNGGATWTGTVSATKGTIPVGTIVDFANTTAPSGWYMCYGQAISRTTYAALFTVLGTTYGSGDGSTTFNLPDYRGRTGYGLDNMGGTAAGRISVAGENFDGTVMGNSGGSQNHTMSTNELVQHSHSTNVSDPGHQHTVQLSSSPGSGSGIAQAAGANDTSNVTVNAQTGISVSINNTGNTSPFTVLSPAIIVIKIIYAGV